MSLVNEMLNDLQQSNHPTPMMDGLISPSDSKPKTRTTKLVVLFLLVSIGVFFLVYSRNNFFSNHNEAPVETNTNIDKIQSENSQLEAKESPPPIKTVTRKKDFQIQRAVTTANKDSTAVEKTQKTSTNASQALPKKLNTRKLLVAETKAETNSLKEEKRKPGVASTDKVKKVSRISLAEKELSRLTKHWQLARPQDSFKQLLSLLHRYPDLPGIWSDSLTFLKSKNLGDYENLLALSVKNFPETNSFSFMSAQHYFSSGQYLKASHQLKLIEDANRDKKTYRLAGLIMQKLGKHQLAIENYRKLLVIVPDQGDINMAIGISYDALNQPKEAVNYFILALNDKNLNPIQKRFVKQRLTAYQG